MTMATFTLLQTKPPQWPTALRLLFSYCSLASSSLLVAFVVDETAS